MFQRRFQRLRSFFIDVSLTPYAAPGATDKVTCRSMTPVCRSVTGSRPSVRLNSRWFMLGLSILDTRMRQTGVQLRKFAILLHR